MSKPLSYRVFRPLWFVFAAIFLFEAWLWDLLGQALTRLAALIPFESFKQMLARSLDRLPAPVVLAVFLVPLGIIEPFKILGLWLVAHHHLVLGILAFVAAKVAGLGVMAFLFEMTRAKLLSMAWFESFYLWMLRLRAWAHQLVAPYKLAIREALAPFKARLRELMLAMAANGGGIARRLALLRNRARRSRSIG